MLSLEEREQLTASETFKAEVRAELVAAGAKPKATEPALSGFFMSDSFRWIVSSMAIPLTVFLWGEHAKDEAEKDRRQVALQADKERALRQSIETTHRNIDLVIKLLPGLNQPPAHTERLNALAILISLEKDGQLSPTLRASLDANVEGLKGAADSRGLVTSPAARLEVEALARAAPSSTDFERSTARASDVVIPGAKTYIQYFDESQRQQAERIREVSRALGIAAPGIENVVATAQKRGRKPPQGYDGAVLLVFKKDDEATARLLAEAVQKQEGLALSVLDRSDRPVFKDVPSGQLEIWLTDPSRKQR